MAIYEGLLDPDLEEDFQHRVTLTRSDSGGYDEWGDPLPEDKLENIPALWVEKTTLVAGDKTASIVSYATVYLPPDVHVKIGNSLKNEQTGVERIVASVRPPIYDDDPTIPYTAWLE